jgi:hypothetical protein
MAVAEINLAEIMRELYPSLDPVRDYMVADRHDGAGLVLMIWDEARLGPRPSGAEIEAARQTIAARPRPIPPQHLIVPYDVFRARFTDAEKAALHQARKDAWQIDDLVGLAQGNGFVDVSKADDAKAALVAAGVLTAERAAVVFAPGA